MVVYVNKIKTLSPQLDNRKFTSISSASQFSQRAVLQLLSFRGGGGGGGFVQSCPLRPLRDREQRHSGETGRDKGVSQSNSKWLFFNIKGKG